MSLARLIPGVRVAVALALALVASLLSPARAHGDADPASDFLLAAPVFYPYKPATSPPFRQALESTTKP